MNPTRVRQPPPRRKPRTSRGKCPTHLRRFPDFDLAVAAAVRVSRALGPLRCEHCPRCGGFHLKKPRKDV